MPSHNASTATGGTILAVLPWLFKDWFFDRSRKRQSVNPRNYAGTITGHRQPIPPYINHDRREVPHLPRQNTDITGSNTEPLRRLISKFQKWIRKNGHKTLRFPRTQKVNHGIIVQPNQDACAWNQEEKNAVNRNIEWKNSSGDWSHPYPSSDPRTKQHQLMINQLHPSTLHLC